MVMREDQVLGIASLPYVLWIQPFRPEFKYDAATASNGDNLKLSVESIIGDQQLCRSDLEQCGATSVASSTLGAYYSIALKVETLGCVADLWWVLYLETIAEPVNN